MPSKLINHSLLLSLLLASPMQTMFAGSNLSMRTKQATQTKRAEQIAQANSTHEQGKPREKKIINWPRLAAKFGIGLITGITSHFFMEYATTWAHEHGHGLSDMLLINGCSYTIELTQTRNMPHVTFWCSCLFPWMGACTGMPSGSPVKEAIGLMAGPAAGIITTSAQLFFLKAAQNYIHQKESQKPTTVKPYHAFSFLSDFIQMIKKYSAHMLGKKLDKDIKEPSWTSVMLYCAMFLRCSRIIGEAIYGFTPLTAIDNADGTRLWNLILEKIV